jgi:hypothetical protein
MMEERLGEVLRLDWFNLRPSMSMLPLLENSILLVGNSSSPNPLGLTSKDNPMKLSVVFAPASFPDTTGLDIEGFDDNHLLSSPVL